MGSNQSNHKLTIVNESDDMNIIKISDGIAQKIIQNEKDENFPHTEDVTTTYLPPIKAYSLHEGEMYYPHYTISAMEVQQQKQKELENQEDYWKNRLNNLQKNHDKIDQKLLNEFNQAKNIFDDYKVKNMKSAGSSCKNFEENLINCYNDNQSKVLNCSKLFSEYAECVSAQQEKCMPFD